MMAALLALLGITPAEKRCHDTPSEVETRHQEALEEAERGMRRAESSRIRATIRPQRAPSWEELLRAQEIRR